MKNILVFGASGFIGTYLIDELQAQGYDVTASDIDESGREYYTSKNIKFISIDITKRESFSQLSKEPYSAIIHLAACQPANVSDKTYDPREYINVNVIGTLNILEYCRESETSKIIYVSSHRNTQGLWAANTAIREDDGRKIKYTGEYAMFSISESAAQDCVLHYQAQHGLPGIIFRLPPVYGYGPHTEIFKNGKPIKTGFQVFIDRAQKCLPLEVWGDGSIGRDIIYVKDVVSAFIKAIESPNASGLYNITSGKYLTLREQAETIADLFWGNDSAPKIVERRDMKNDIESFLYDTSRAKRDLAWAPEYSFSDMLLDYMKESENKRFEYLVNKRQAMLNRSKEMK
ncbi:MAG: NAD-dependent epimerase/dehydratase family protein [Acidobacteriota bacterium]